MGDLLPSAEDSSVSAPLLTSAEFHRLTEIERDRLTHLEGITEGGKDTWYEVGSALLEIRDSKFYREKYANFEAYLKDRWGISRSRGYQLMDATKAMSTVVDKPLNERQARAMIKAAKPVIDDAKRRRVQAQWERDKAEVEERTKREAEARAARVQAMEANPETICDAASATEHLTANDPWYDWTDSEKERREQAEQGTTALAKNGVDRRLIWWASEENRFVNIDIIPWANPMKSEWMRDHRERMIWYAEHWLPFVTHLSYLELFPGKVLGCGCRSELCHGVELIKWAKAKIEEDKDNQ